MISNVHYIEHVWSDSELETLCNYFQSQVIPNIVHILEELHIIYRSHVHHILVML